MIKFIKNHKWQLLFLLSIMFVFYWGWLNHFEFIGRGDLTVRTTDWLKELFAKPYTWHTSEYGGFNTLYGSRISKYPIYLISSLLFKIFGFDWAIFQRIFWFFPFLILGFFIYYYILIKLFKNKIIALFAVIIFMGNGITLVRNSNGQIALLLGQAFLPIMFYLIYLLYKKRNLKYAIYFTIIANIMLMHEIRMCFLIGIFIFFYTIYFLLTTNNKKIFIKNLIYYLLVIGSLTFLINFFWLYFINSGVSNFTPEGFFDIRSVFNFSKTTDLKTILSLQMTDEFNHGIFSSYSRNLFLIIIAIIGIVNIYKLNKKITIFLSIILLIFLFLTKGSNPPFSNINIFLYEHLPSLFAAFRHPLKFSYIYIFPYSVFFGIGIYSLYKYFKNNIYILLILVFTTMYILINPLYIDKTMNHSNYGSSFIKYDFSSYIKINNYLRDQEKHYKIFWLHDFPTLSVYNSNFPAIYMNTYSNLGYFRKINSYFVRRIIDYIHYKKHDFLANQFQYLENETSNFKSLGLFNIKYFALWPKNQPGWALKDKKFDQDVSQLQEIYNENYSAYKKLIEGQEGIHKIYDNDIDNLYYLDKVNNKIYQSENCNYVIGNLDSLLLFAKSNNYLKNSYFFNQNQNKKEISKIINRCENIIFYNKSKENYLLDNISDQYYLYPYNYISRNDLINYSNQWNILNSTQANYIFHSHIITNNNFIIASNKSNPYANDPNELEYKNSAIKFDIGSFIENRQSESETTNNEYEVWIEALPPDNNRSLNLTIDNQTINIDTNYLYNKQINDLQWIYLGKHKLDKNSNITIENIMTQNIWKYFHNLISRFAIIPTNEFETETANTNNNLNKPNIFTIYEAEKINKISFEKENHKYCPSASGGTFVQIQPGHSEIFNIYNNTDLDLNNVFINILNGENLTNNIDILLKINGKIIHDYVIKDNKIIFNASLSQNPNVLEVVNKSIHMIDIDFIEITSHNTNLFQKWNEKYENNIFNQAIFEMIDPTKYKVEIFEKDKYLIFNENYDTNWTLTDVKSGETINPALINGAVQGYYIENTGNYILEYEPQKTMDKIIYVSIVGWFLILILLIIPKNKFQL